MITITDSDHLAIARRYAERIDDWPFAPRFDPAQRWFKRLAGEDDIEVWALTWLPGQGTDLHDHGGSAGAFLVLAGELTEHSVIDRRQLVAGTVAAGDGRRFGPRHVHQIVNNGDFPAISLHVYGPRLTTMTRYLLDAGVLVTVAIDRAGTQW
jgi:predicted metal-dependent enzyme (double-stranded beta helix superfamily)